MSEEIVIEEAIAYLDGFCRGAAKRLKASIPNDRLDAVVYVAIGNSLFDVPVLIARAGEKLLRCDLMGDESVPVSRAFELVECFIEQMERDNTAWTDEMVAQTLGISQ